MACLRGHAYVGAIQGLAERIVGIERPLSGDRRPVGGLGVIVPVDDQRAGRTQDAACLVRSYQLALGEDLEMARHLLGPPGRLARKRMPQLLDYRWDVVAGHLPHAELLQRITRRVHVWKLLNSPVKDAISQSWFPATAFIAAGAGLVTGGGSKISPSSDAHCGPSRQGCGPRC